jgi:small-conductance mechanosensitive channel
MKLPSILEGAGVALVASIGGGVFYQALSTLFATDFLLRLVIAVTGLLYILYLLQRSGEKVGRIASITLWIVSATVFWVIGLSLPFYLMAHLGLVWLIRSLYFYSSLISAMADFALVLFGMVCALWAVLQTGSLFLSLWCFFLVQALFVMIPDSWKRSSESGLSRNSLGNTQQEHFQNAYRSAVGALNRLSVRR